MSTECNEMDDEIGANDTHKDPVIPAHNNLSIQLEIINKQIAADHLGRPTCVQHGSNWHNSCDPYYTLMQQIKANKMPDPGSVIHPDIYVNIPHLYNANLVCSCGMLLTGHGWCQPFRRVACTHKNWYLLSKSYWCDNRGKRYGCGKSFVGHAPHILQQLPRGVQQVFPAFITKKMAISTKLAEMLAPLLHHRLGPSPLQKIVREWHTKHYDQLHIMYLDAVLSCLQSPAYAGLTHLYNQLLREGLWIQC